MRPLTTHTEASMRAINNGRKSLPELNEIFDKVIVRYHPSIAVEKDGSKKETIKTIVALVSGNTVYVGISKWSNRGFQYSKTKGRAMAMGRAEIAFNNSKSIEGIREAHYSGLDPLAYTTTINGELTTRNIIESLIAVEELNNDLV